VSSSAKAALNGLLKALLAVGIIAVALLALLVAWWIALLFIGTLLLVAGVRRLLGGARKNPPAPTSGATLDGEFRVEHDPPPKMRPGVIESRDGRPPG